MAESDNQGINRPPRPSRGGVTQLGSGATGAASTLGKPGQHEEIVELLTASIAEMLARALRQSVEQAVEQAFAKHQAQPPGQAANTAAHNAQAQAPRTF